MSTSQMSGVIQHLRRAALRRDGAGLTDGQLLADYLSRRDDNALAALVLRHGPMVWGVCRRVLHNHHDAEDAFQATFLVLVRKAASIASRELVANWLYGVAHQTALKARATTAKRKGRERQATEMPEPAVAEQDLWHDLQPLLDEELSRLPDKYRSVIVLCELEGKTRKEAARQLGVPEGTVGGWLARARTTLAKRLAQRGVVLSGGALAAVVSQNAASAGVLASVASSTIKAASLYAAGQAAGTGVISAKAAALAEGVLKTMLLTKLKIATAALLVVALLGATVGTFIGAAPGQAPANANASKPPAADRPAEEKKPPPASPGSLMLIGGRHQDLSTDLRDVFFDLAGGKRAKIVVIPTAVADDDREKLDKLLNPWRELKPQSVQILHTRDRKTADDPAFVKPLTEATAVFFTNGHPDRILNAYRGTLVQKELKNLQSRGGLVGGTGTGMSVLGDFVLWHKEPGFEPALGILPGFLPDDPDDERLSTAIAANPAQVGLGIEPGAAVVIRGKNMRVIGKGTVKVHLAKGAKQEAKIDTFKPGDRLDLVELHRAAATRAGK
jgi:cyanophycinase